MTSIKNLTLKIIKDYSKNNNIIPIQRKQNKKFINDEIGHNFNNSSNNYKESAKIYEKYIINSK